MKTINSMSKTHFYRTIEYTSVYAVVIDTTNYEIDKSYIVTLNLDVRSACKIADIEHKSEEQVDKEYCEYCKQRVQSTLPENKQVVTVTDFIVNKAAYALSYSDLIRYGVQLEKDAEGTWYYPDDN